MSNIQLAEINTSELLNQKELSRVSNRLFSQQIICIPLSKDPQIITQDYEPVKPTLQGKHRNYNYGLKEIM